MEEVIGGDLNRPSKSKSPEASPLFSQMRGNRSDFKIRDNSTAIELYLPDRGIPNDVFDKLCGGDEITDTVYQSCNNVRSDDTAIAFAYKRT